MGGRDHRRPLELLGASPPTGDILLRAEELPPLRGRADPEGAGTEGHVLEEEDWVDEEATSQRGPDD
jgi:hypothetical protein